MFLGQDWSLSSGLTLPKEKEEMLLHNDCLHPNQTQSKN